MPGSRRTHSHNLEHTLQTLRFPTAYLALGSDPEGPSSQCGYQRVNPGR
jgi:hypothetical protein